MDSITPPPANQNSSNYKLVSNEAHAPKPPLASNNSHKLALTAAVAVIIIGAGIAGYYFYAKDSASSLPVATPSVSPTITPVADKNSDTDKDGLPDAIEKVLGTYLTKADTDGDGFNDLQEIKSGYSPLIAGSVGKYSLQEWDLVKGKIKIEDREFYEKEFGVPVVSPSPIVSVTPSPVVSQAPSSSSVAVKKCEYPEKIGEYTKQTAENTPLYDEKNKTKVAASGILVNYYIDNFNMITGIFFNLDNFDNEQKEIVSTLYLSKKGRESCNIGGVTGVCVFKGDLPNGDDILGLDFIWTDGKNTKIAQTGFALLSLTKEEAANLKGVEEIKEKIKNNLILFVNQFKDCAVESIK